VNVEKRVLILLAAVFLLSACSADEERQIELMEKPLASASPFQSQLASPTLQKATATPDTKDAPEPVFDKAACIQAGGDIEIFEFDSIVPDLSVRLRVYTPPCYKQQATRRYPVLILIHGQSFNDDQWNRLGADELATSLIAAEDVAPFLIVMPFSASSRQPSADPFQAAFIEEILPFVEDNFRTASGRENWAIGGLSRGASWAFHFALNYPELFSAVGGHSPPIFSEDATKVRGWLSEIDADQMPRIWLDIGDKDQEAILESAQWFESVLDEMEIAHEWHLFPGRHDESYWSSHLELYLRWYAQNW
jgi:enterochelin esterase-like enzyme